MPEIEPGADYLQEGYWGIHTPQDNCPWIKRISPVPYETIGALLEGLAMRKPIRQAANAINKYLKFPSTIPVASFRERGIFRGDDYPLDTIVAFCEEKLSLDFHSKPAFFRINPFYHKLNYWGVVVQVDCPKPVKTVLMRVNECYVDREKGRVGRSNFFSHDPTLEVGKTIHSRHKENQHDREYRLNSGYS